MHPLLAGRVLSKKLDQTDARQMVMELRAAEHVAWMEGIGGREAFGEFTFAITARQQGVQ